MSINETVVTLSNIHQALQQGRVNEAALQTIEALEAARQEEEAYEAYLEARYAEHQLTAGSPFDVGEFEDVPF
jgi:hypothetical protein